MASGVPRKRRSALAPALRCWRSSMLTCQQAVHRQPGTSTRESSPRRSCWATRCSTAGAARPAVGRRRLGGGLVGEHADHVLGDPGLGQQLPGGGAGVGAGRVHQPAPLARAAPEAGLPGGDHDQAVAEDRLGHHGQRRVVGHAGADRDVGQPVGDQHPHLLGRRHADRHLDRARVPPGERLHQRADHELRDGGGGDHPQLLGRALSGADRGVRLGAEHDDLRGGGEQAGAARRSASSPPGRGSAAGRPGAGGAPTGPGTRLAR